MKVRSLAIPQVKVVEPDVFEDDRGYFFESYHQKKFEQVGITDTFVQDNQSLSQAGTLRGLHFQLPPKSQAKLVRVISGEIFDVAVDLRPNSPTYGQWVSEILSADNKRMLYIPEYFAHGIYVLSETAEVHYKCNEFYDKSLERSVLWNDETINISWPLISESLPLLSEKDAKAPTLEEFKETLLAHHVV